jgi:hypothetical protein
MATAMIEGTESGGDSPGDALVSSLVAVLPSLGSDPASITAAERSEVVLALASAVGQAEALLGQFANVSGANLDHVLDGARTQKAWLTARSELSKAQAGRALKLDRDLARYPRLLDAWRRGVLGTDKVRLLLDAAPHVEAMLERDQSMLIERLQAKTVDGARASIRLWREGRALGTLRVTR